MMDKFEIGSIVTDGKITGEVLNIHPTYATIVSEGKEYRIWVKCLSLSDTQLKRNQLYKESYIFKGYKTKNFTRSLSEAFKDMANRETDEYAILECLKVFDYMIGVTDQTITENFKTVRIQVERLRRYSKKIGATYLTDSILSLVEEELLKCAILEDMKFSTTDKNMVSKVVAMVAGTQMSADPTNTVNQAVIALRTSQLTPQGWAMVGRLLNVATKIGIRWNKDTFSASIKKEMNLV